MKDIVYDDINVITLLKSQTRNTICVYDSYKTLFDITLQGLNYIIIQHNIIVFFYYLRLDFNIVVSINHSEIVQIII